MTTSNFDNPANDNRFQLLVESVSDYAIYMLDTAGRIVTWNAGAQRFKGYEAHEIVGQHFSRFFTPEDRSASLPERILQTAAQEGRYENEGRRLRKDGTEIWVHVVVDPIKDSTGELVGFAKITRDITEKRKADTALFRSEQQFRMLVQGVRDYAIYMLDLGGHVTNWNVGAELIKGYKADDIIGEHFSRFYTPEDRNRGEPALALQTALDEGRYEREAERVRKDGTRFWAHVVIDPIRDETGQVVGFAKITRDVTDKRRVQEELEEARVALFQSQKLQAIGELTGGIAHDFNNLITIIRGSAELLKNPNLSLDRHDRYVDAILSTADRATTLTSRLLAFARRQSLKPEVLNLAVRLDALGEVLSRTLGSKIKVVVDVPSDVRPIEADAAEFENALLNAAFNARDAMPDGGTLTLEARNVDGQDLVCVSVIDTGQGIPTELIERVFEPFFTTKPEGKGTGLGLSQIHGFAAQSGGRATIRSQLGEGTAVSLLLPRSSSPAIETIAEYEPGDRLDNLRILLVEDNDGVRSFGKSLLEDLGANVTEAATAEEAEAVLESGSYDLVFSDVVMPGRSGIELARSLNNARPDQRVLLATGYSKEVSSGDAAGFRVIQKPYGAQSLANAIRQCLGEPPSSNS
jgi:PAS domain S-box-containing protein